MSQIPSVEEYKARIRENKQRFSAVVKNSMVLPDGMAGPIAEGRVTLQTAETGIGMLVDEGDYLDLNYFVEKGASFPDFTHEKPILVIQLSRVTDAPEKEQETARWLAEAGYRFYRRIFQLVRPLEADGAEIEERVRRSRERLAAHGLSLHLGCPPGQLPEVFRLWESRLDFGDIQAEHRTFPERPDLQFACVTDPENGRIVGTYLWKILGRDSSQGMHVVTHPDYGRRGVGTALLDCCLQDLAGRGIRQHFTWIHEDNAPSFALHHGAGFRENGRVSTLYIKE